MTEEIIQPTIEMLTVLVTSTLNSFQTERRFPKNITIGELKKKLELLTGASSSSMKVQLKDKENHLVAEMEEDSSTLGSYKVSDNIIIHVIDTTHQTGEYEDLSKIEKYEMSREEYEKRGESLRAFKMKNKLGMYNEEEMAKRQEMKEQKLKEEEELAKNINVGNRCEVKISDQPAKKGTVMFVGLVHFKPGYWIGIHYDEPLGKNDGSVDDKKYFECPPKYGGFVKPKDVTIGDFPVEELNLDDEL